MPFVKEVRKRLLGINLYNAKLQTTIYIDDALFVVRSQQELLHLHSCLKDYHEASNITINQDK